MPINQEYYFTNKSEIESFIETFATNAKKFEYHKYLRDLDQESKTIKPVEKPGLVNPDGSPLS